MEFLINNPEIKHGKVRVGSLLMKKLNYWACFNVDKFGAEWAYYGREQNR
jgi:tripeptide aminopeptidase